MEWRMERAEMRELGTSGDVQKLDRLRQLQQRRRGEQEIVGQREDGANRAGIGRLVVGVVVRRLLRRGFRSWPLRGEGRSNRKIGIGQPGLNCRRRPGGHSVEMPERQRKLDRERKQRQPRAALEVFSEPVHDDVASPLGAQAFPPAPMLRYNIAKGGRVSIDIRLAGLAAARHFARCEIRATPNIVVPTAPHAG